ncbi:CTD small phosphatase-like protein 2 [Mycoemilia scoparia]|uniref:CTD small phosphatase-like protein 2 n=1 Tax=Mycoemilia scoparia TaxID=417184 RepID=A0A9W8A7B5_9FUNG|nr:CTD small phosphatase-like protein 2 [Mycoemilia scoparia]
MVTRPASGSIAIALPAPSATTTAAGSGPTIRTTRRTRSIKSKTNVDPGPTAIRSTPAPRTTATQTKRTRAGAKSTAANASTKTKAANNSANKRPKEAPPSGGTRGTESTAAATKKSISARTTRSLRSKNKSPTVAATDADKPSSTFFSPEADLITPSSEPSDSPKKENRKRSNDRTLESDQPKKMKALNVVRAFSVQVEKKGRSKKNETAVIPKKAKKADTATTAVKADRRAEDVESKYPPLPTTPSSRSGSAADIKSPRAKLPQTKVSNIKRPVQKVSAIANKPRISKSKIATASMASGAATGAQLPPSPPPPEVNFIMSSPKRKGTSNLYKSTMMKYNKVAAGITKSKTKPNSNMQIDINSPKIKVRSNDPQNALPETPTTVRTNRDVPSLTSLLPTKSDDDNDDDDDADVSGRDAVGGNKLKKKHGGLGLMSSALPSLSKRQRDNEDRSMASTVPRGDTDSTLEIEHADEVPDQGDDSNDDGDTATRDHKNQQSNGAANENCSANGDSASPLKTIFSPVINLLRKVSGSNDQHSQAVASAVEKNTPTNTENKREIGTNPTATGNSTTNKPQEQQHQQHSELLNYGVSEDQTQLTLMQHTANSNSNLTAQSPCSGSNQTDPNMLAYSNGSQSQQNSSDFSQWNISAVEAAALQYDVHNGYNLMAMNNNGANNTSMYSGDNNYTTTSIISPHLAATTNTSGGHHQQYMTNGGQYYTDNNGALVPTNIDRASYNSHQHMTASPYSVVSANSVASTITSPTISRTGVAATAAQTAGYNTNYHQSQFMRYDQDSMMMTMSDIDEYDNSMHNNGEDEENQDIIEAYILMGSLPPIPKEHLQRPFVLPRKTRSSPPITLVLDLDETLVHCSVTEIKDPDLIFPVEFDGTIFQVHCRLRPKYLEFLERVSKIFEVVLFTASQQAYANKLMNYIDPQRKLVKYRLFRDSCVNINENYIKDLSILGRDIGKVVIVDNAPQTYGYQQSNGIPIRSWYEDPNDNELMMVLEFLETLVGKEDVRPLVDSKFNTRKKVEKYYSLSSRFGFINTPDIDFNDYDESSSDDDDDDEDEDVSSDNNDENNTEKNSNRATTTTLASPPRASSSKASKCSSKNNINVASTTPAATSTSSI